MSVSGGGLAPKQSPGIARKNTSALISADDFEVLFSGAELVQQLGGLAYPVQATSISVVPRKTRYQTPYVLPDSELKSTYSRHVSRLFNQDRTIANLGRASPHAPTSGISHGVLSDTVKNISESEFGYRLSTYEAKAEDSSSKEDVGLASFTSHRDFATPGKYRVDGKDRTSLMRSAHLATEPFVSLKPKSQEFCLTSPLDFLLVPKELSFAFGSVEPLFGTLSLWDAVNGLKLSEDFTFHLNTEATLSVIGSGKDIDPIWAAKTFGLTIDPAQRSPRLYLLLVVSKVLVGDLDTTIDVYTKGKDVKDKDRNKFVTENTESIKHLRAFRQQFAMAAYPLFKEDGTLNCSGAGDVRIDGFTRIKSVDVGAFLEETYKADRKTKERKGGMPGLFAFQVMPFTSHMNHTRISPTLAYAETVTTTSSNGGANAGQNSPPPVPKNLDRIREVANFVMPSFGSVSSLSSSSAMQALPALATASSLYPSHSLLATEALNNVYFMPTRLNIDHLGGSSSSSSSARNICMEVKLLISDSNPDAVGQAWLYGDATYLSKATFMTAARTSVWYHNKKPRFLEEFKFHLPISVNEKHHILVTFFHVNCKISSKSEKQGAVYQLEEPIAYSAIPLLPRAAANASTSTLPHKLIRNGIYGVPVVSKSAIGPKYLDADLFDLDADASSSKGMLEFQIRVNSNVHSSDAVVDEYLQAASGLHSLSLETAALASLEAFLSRGESSLLYQSKASQSTSETSNASSHGTVPGTSVNKREVLRFLPMLMTTHLSLLCHESRKVRAVAFIAILQTLVDAVEASPQNAPSQIQSYIDLVFDGSVNNVTVTDSSSSKSLSISGASSSEKLYMIILQHWAGLNSQISPLRDVAMRFAWVFAGLVAKSAALHLAEEKRIASDIAGPLTPKSTAFGEVRSKWFPKAFYDALTDFFSSAATATRQYHTFDHLSSFVAHRFAVHLASFVSDLYALVDRGQLNKAVLVYLDKMVNYEDPNSSTPSQYSLDHIVTRCLFFKVLSQHPNFYAWNLPDLQEFTSGGDMLRAWQQRHVLVAAWLDTFKMSYHQSSPESARDLILDTLIDMLHRLDSNPELLEEEAKISASVVDKHYLPNVPSSTVPGSLGRKSRIAALFMPYVYYLIDKYEYFDLTLSSRERAKSLIPFMWVLKHAPYDVLAKYWERDSEKRIFAMLKLCTHAANAFELAPEKLVKLKRELVPLSNTYYSLQQQDVWAAMSSENTAGNSAPNSRHGTGNSATMQAALDEASSSAPSGSSPGPSDSDNLGLLSSGMRALQVPGGAGTVKTKKNRRASDLPPTLVPNRHSGSNISAASQPYNSGTLRRKGELELEVRREMNFCREIALIIVDLVVAFANTFPRALKRRDTFEQLWTPLLTLISRRLTVDANQALLETVYHLLPAFKVHFFAKQNSACPDLIYNTLKACTAPQLIVRKSALSVLMRIIQSNYVATGNIDRFRLQATIAIIKVVGGGQGHTPQNSGGVSTANAPASTPVSIVAKNDFARIKASLAKASRELLKDDARAILQPSTSVMDVRAGKDSTSSAPSTPASDAAAKKALISKGLEELEKKVEKILEDNAKMKQYDYDTETLIDLYYGMSRNLEDSPDERIGWLENVAEMHRANGNLEECAQTKVVIAALVQAYLKVLGRWDLSQKIVPAFHLVAPNMEDDQSLSASTSIKKSSQDVGSVSTSISREHYHSLRSVKDEVCQSSTFSSKGFGTLLMEAIQLLKEGGFYESCAAAYRMILPTYYENDNYQMQKKCYAELQWLCQQILDENVMKQRIFSNYYRVVVYGSKLGPEVNGVEFVYKELPTMRLMDFSEKIKRSYESKFGEGNVVILPNTQVVKVNELDPQKIFMQLCNLEVYWLPEQLVERNTGFKQQFGVRRFVMEQPFTKPKGGKDGAAQAGGFEDQHIRRTIYSTKECFPHLLKRSRVVDKEEVELSPIECAIALVEKRTRALKAELSSSSPNMKNIQRELQGAVLTQVNAGPLAVINTFLSDANSSKYTSTTSVLVRAGSVSVDPTGKTPSGTMNSSALSGSAAPAASPIATVTTHREILADCVTEFERSVAFGLALNKAMLLSTDETSASTTVDNTTQVTLQEELTKGLERLRAAISACSIFASRKDARQQLDEEQRRLEAERAHRTLGDENSALATPREKSTKQSNLIKKPDSTSRSGIARSSTAIAEPLSPATLPPPLDPVSAEKSPRRVSKEDKKDKKDKESKERRKVKKSMTDSPSGGTTAVVPGIKIPPPLSSIPPPLDNSGDMMTPKTPERLNSNRSSPLPSPLPSPAAPTPSTPTSRTIAVPAATTKDAISPRARAVSASNSRSQLTQAEKDKEREEREKERLAELKAKAKKTETERVGVASPRLEPVKPKLSADAAVAAPSQPEASATLDSPVLKKKLLGDIDASTDDLMSKAKVMQMGIPEASEPAELAPLIKSLKTFKDSVNVVLGHFPSPPNPKLRPSPTNNGDKLAFFKAVCSNEIENIKLTLAAVSSEVNKINDRAALSAIAESLQSATQAVSGL